MFEACFLLYALICVHSLYINNTSRRRRRHHRHSSPPSSSTGIIANSNKMHGAKYIKKSVPESEQTRKKIFVAYPFELVYYMYYILWFSKMAWMENIYLSSTYFMYLMLLSIFFALPLPFCLSSSSLASMLQYFMKWLRFLFFTLTIYFAIVVSLSILFLFTRWKMCVALLRELTLENQLLANGLYMGVYYWLIKNKMPQNSGWEMLLLLLCCVLHCTACKRCSTLFFLSKIQILIKTL